MSEPRLLGPHCTAASRHPARAGRHGCELPSSSSQGREFPSASPSPRAVSSRVPVPTAVSSRVPPHTPLSTAVLCTAPPALAASRLAFLITPPHRACVPGSATARGINPSSRGGPHGPAWAPCHLPLPPLPRAPPPVPPVPQAHRCAASGLSRIFPLLPQGSARAVPSGAPFTLPPSHVRFLLSSRCARHFSGTGQIVCPAP